MDERLQALLIGAVIGFLFGYIVRSLREINQKVDRVDKRVSHFHEKDENGAVSTGLLTRIGLLLAVAMTVYAAVVSQVASNDVRDAQDAQGKIVSCTEDFLGKTISAANARTQYSVEQSTANIDLQKAQQSLLAIIFHKPPPGQAESLQAALKYFDALNHYVDVTGKQTSAIQDNPYPSNREFKNCLSGKTKPN